MAKNPSRLRQSLLEVERERTQRLKRILAERGPMIRGAYVEQGVRCGKPNCKCARGEYHGTAQLKVSEQGAAAKTYVPLSDRERVKRLAGRYRGYRKERADLAKFSKKTLELVDDLQQALTQPYPEAQPKKGKPRRKAPSGANGEDAG